MKDFIKSKFLNKTIFWFMWMGIVLIFTVTIVVRSLINFNFYLSDILFTLLFILLVYFNIIILRQVKYIMILNDELVFYSILHPLGKKLNLKDFTAKLLLKESGSAGIYRVIYLVNKNNFVAFKIMELFYKNFDEIDKALSLKVMKFSPSTLQYFKLLLFGNLRLEASSTKITKSSNHLQYIRIFIILGLSLFILTLILKFTKMS